ncbi:MAG TPA: nucleotide pyrophosphatase/phosphodiesterase family protein [Catenuloplanes sp.]|jgi:hypothetical protein
MIDETTALRPVRPRYGATSLADLLPSACAVLGVPGAPDPLRLRERLDGVRRIAVLLIDGLGAYQLPLAAPYAPTLTDLATGRLGHATTLTSGFPSTTPTSLVTLGTGVPPGSHGVLGFVLNVPGGDRLLNHIRWGNDPDPALWQPVPTRLEAAAAAGVEVTVVTKPEFAGSGLTVAANRGGEFRGAGGVDAVATEMLAALRAGSGPTLVSGYHPDLDKAGHDHGVDSTEWREAAAGVDALVERLVGGLPPDGALLVTADHGMLNVPAEGRFDLDADPRLSAGLRLVAGEARVRYLHVLPGARDDVLAAWRSVLGPAAWVTTRAEAVAEGWFGAVAPAHQSRLGDVVVVCRERHVVLATTREPVRATPMIAFHGSFTAVEMTIPLLVAVGRQTG